MKIIDCIQGSEEWYLARLGKATGSCFSKVLAKQRDPKKDGVRKKYIYQIAAERLTGLPQEAFSNDTMLRGNEVEPQARAAYEAIYGVTVELVGFCELSDDVGCSPDGLIGEDGTIEIKCPNTTTHIETILKNKVPTQYIAQIQGLLWITDRKWCDFVSFDPRMKSNRIKVIRVMRDDAYIKNLMTEIDRFIKDLEKLMDNFDSPF